MANFIKGIINHLNLDEDDDDDYEDDDKETVDYKVDVKDYVDDDKDDEPAPKRFKPFKKQVNDSYDDVDDEPEKVTKPVRNPFNSGRVVNIKQGASYSSRGGSNMELKVIRPKEYDDSKDICDTLKEGMPIILNLEGINSELAQKILDFTSGAVYAMNGNLQKVTNYILVVTPANVPISGNFDEFLEGVGDFSGSKYGIRE